MVNGVSNTNNGYRYNYHELAPDKGNQVAVGVAAGGGAVALLSNGRRAFRAVSGVSQKAGALGTVAKQEKKAVTRGLLNMLERAGKTKFLKPVAALAKNPVMKKAAACIGGFSALGVVATQGANMINTGVKLHDKYTA